MESFLLIAATALMTALAILCMLAVKQLRGDRPHGMVVMAAPQPPLMASRPEIAYGHPGAPSDAGAYVALKLAGPTAAVATEPDRLIELLIIGLRTIEEVEPRAAAWRLRVPAAWLERAPVSRSVTSRFRAIVEAHDDDRHVEIAFQPFGADLTITSVRIP